MKFVHIADMHFDGPFINLSDKEGLGDLHGSAFLPINVSKLTKDTTCYFDTIVNLKSKSEEIKKYLGCEEKKEDN